MIPSESSPLVTEHLSDDVITDSSQSTIRRDFDCVQFDDHYYSMFGSQSSDGISEYADGHTIFQLSSVTAPERVDEDTSKSLPNNESWFSSSPTESGISDEQPCTPATDATSTQYTRTEGLRHMIV